MKSILICSCILILNTALCYGQGHWKFHIAFEDANGSRDTIWIIWDTTAHDVYPIDTIFNEGQVSFDYSKMNMWTTNFDGDSTKTRAYSYYTYPNHFTDIYAFNYTLPITITWDTSLFHSLILPIDSTDPSSVINIAVLYNQYFQFVNNDFNLQAFNMLIDNHAEAPYFSWGPADHFPLAISFEHYSGIGIEETVNQQIAYFDITGNYLNVNRANDLESLSIYDVSGQRVYFSENKVKTVDLTFLNNGIYICILKSTDKKYHYEKICKFN